MEQRTCGGCGVSLEGRSPSARWCTGRCRARSLRSDPVFRAAEVRRQQGYMARRRSGMSSRVYYPECTHCGRLFAARSANKRMCSNRCRNARSKAAGQVTGSWQRGRQAYLQRRRDAGLPLGNNTEARRDMARRRRAKLKGRGVEKIDLTAVAERDRWVCQLCGRKVAKARLYPDPLSRSLDHIVPLSRGGDHVLANVHLAHLGCNTAKSTKPAGEQLRLVG